jgi:nucleobase:cation symporter-1, NCS1 family
LRAYAAYLAGILINAVGFAGASELTLPHDAHMLNCCPAGRVVPLAATRIYELSFFTGFGVSALVYWTLNRVFPVVGAADTFEEIDVSGYEDSKADGSRDVDTKDEASESASERYQPRY